MFPKVSPSCIGLLLVDYSLMTWFTTFGAQTLFLQFFVLKSITLTFKGLSVEGVKIDLVINALCEGFVGTWAETLRRPIEPFEACLRRALVTASQLV
jgi:hypothetical protein